MNVLIQSFLFFLPAGVANMVPVVVAKMPGLSRLNYSLDLGEKFRGKRILGDHKTVRGLVMGVLVGMLVAFLLHQALLIGFLLSFGALAGDSVKSFFKRQIGIASGKSWFPFDQLDYILGGLLLSLLVVKLPANEYLTIILLYFVLHLLTSFAGFFLGFKSSAI